MSFNNSKTALPITAGHANTVKAKGGEHTRGRKVPEDEEQQLGKGVTPPLSEEGEALAAEHKQITLQGDTATLTADGFESAPEPIAEGLQPIVVASAGGGGVSVMASMGADPPLRPAVKSHGYWRKPIRASNRPL